jgi:hypothetical protein
MTVFGEISLYLIEKNTKKRKMKRRKCERKTEEMGKMKGN